MPRIVCYTIPAVLLISNPVRSQNGSIAATGSMAVVYADHDSIVIGADTKRNIQVMEWSGRDTVFKTSSVISCKISQVDSDVCFASTGTTIDSLTGFSIHRLATDLYSNTMTLEAVVTIYVERVRKALCEIMLARKNFDPTPVKRKIVESVWCGFIDKKPAIFLNGFTYTPTELKPDSITVNSMYWVSTRSVRPYFWWPLGGHFVSIRVYQKFPDYLIKTGPVCGIKAMIIHGTITDSADIGLPIDLAIIKPDTTIWVENGACK